MPLSSIVKQTEEILDEVLHAIRQECEKPTSLLCETDRKNFVEEEESLRKQLRETEGSESNWRSLFCMPSPQARKCLNDAEALRQRVKEDINTKLRTMLFGMQTPVADPGPPLPDVDSEPASMIITSPLNMRCSLSEVPNSELIVYPRNDNHYTSDSSEPANTPLDTSNDQSRDSSSGRQRRSPPPPPPLRRMVQSNNSQTTSNSGSDSPRGSHPVRRPAPPPPQSTGRFSPGSPINGAFPSPSPLPPNLGMMSSISEFTQQMDKFISSIDKDDLSRQAQRQRRLKHGKDYVAKINCVDINGSEADGVTLNIGGSQNSGSVVHKTVLSRLPQPVPQC